MKCYHIFVAMSVKADNLQYLTHATARIEDGLSFTGALIDEVINKCKENTKQQVLDGIKQVLPDFSSAVVVSVTNIVITEYTLS